MTPLTIKKFDLNNMVKNPSILIIGKRGAGKSFLIRDIMYHFRNTIPGGMVVAPSERMNPFYKDFFPDHHIHHDTNEIGKLLVRQTMMMERAKENKQKVNTSAILVMDECLSRKNQLRDDENIMEVLMNGRHYNLTYIATQQIPMGLAPEIRLNFDYVFIFNDDSCINRRKLWNHYGSFFPSIKTFENAFMKCTKNYNAMVINNQGSANISDKIFFYKAKPHTFLFGSSAFREKQQKKYQGSCQKIGSDKSYQLLDDNTDYLFEYFVNPKKLKSPNGQDDFVTLDSPNTTTLFSESSIGSEKFIDCQITECYNCPDMANIVVTSPITEIQTIERKPLNRERNISQTSSPLLIQTRKNISETCGFFTSERAPCKIGQEKNITETCFLTSERVPYKIYSEKETCNAFCEKCGYRRVINQNFCAECGTKFVKCNNNDKVLELSYQDETCQLLVTTKNADHVMTRILCDYIEKLRNNKTACSFLN